MTRRSLLFGAAIVMLLLAAWVAPVREWLGHLLVWIEAHRETAWLSFVAAYVLACVPLLPGLQDP